MSDIVKGLGAILLIFAIVLIYVNYGFTSDPHFSISSLLILVPPVLLIFWGNNLGQKK